jgi:hypothetical protein
VAALESAEGDGALIFFRRLSCRTGPLRVARPLRGVCTGRGRPEGMGPRVARRVQESLDSKLGLDAI